MPGLKLTPGSAYDFLSVSVDEWINNSVPIDISLFSYSTRVIQLVDQLYKDFWYEDYVESELEDKIFGLPKSKKRQIIHKDTIIMVLMNLYHKYCISGHSGSIAISRNNNNWKKNRYNPTGTTISQIKRVLDCLMWNNLMLQHMGKVGDIGGKVTRICASPELIELFSTHDITEDVIHLHQENEVIELSTKVPMEDNHWRTRNKKRILLEYNDNGFTTQAREQVIRHINHLKQFDIQCSSYSIFTKVDTYRVKRVFNTRNDFSLGGRIYAGFWQNIPSDHRNNITINGASVVELDFINCQLKITYALEGIFYKEDGYILEGYEDPVGRSILKKILLMCLNTPSKNSARQAAQSWINECKKKDEEIYNYYKANKIRIGKLIDQFAEKHADISGYFFKEHGLKIMRIDSDICMSIVQMFIDANKPILTVHDSFIVKEEDEDLLKESMKSEFEKATSIKIDDIHMLVKKE
ncbi:MAG: hypothetical protein KZQ85_01850 [Candidatus Thiodiazotropha sp. (ex Myrtea sp. 'scaly one' KF741663)]|nr:hypothetical protein [Candidatus Thiodiazotropha sp. (ex Myrtea sp. 'scaly one' KF741663)]